MENETKADARVVKTVRRLKSTKPEQAPNSQSTKNKENHNSINSNSRLINNLSTEDLLHKSKTKVASSDSRSAKTTNDTIHINNQNLVKVKTKESSSKISIDGATSKPQTSNIERKNYQPYNYQNLKKLMKTKTEYQKNILATNNIAKYKSECINLIHNDKELKSLLAKCNIMNDNNYDVFLDNIMFTKKHFLFRLEMLILNDIQESNTLKVFSTNKKRVPIKIAKENFYKDEIKRHIMKKIYDEDYANKIKNLFEHIDSHISNLNNFEL